MNEKMCIILHDPFVLDIECIARFSYTQNVLWPKIWESTPTCPQRRHLSGRGSRPGRARVVSGHIHLRNVYKF